MAFSLYFARLSKKAASEGDRTSLVVLQFELKTKNEITENQFRPTYPGPCNVSFLQAYKQDLFLVFWVRCR